MTTRRLQTLDVAGDLDTLVSLRAAWRRERGDDGDATGLGGRIREWLGEQGDSRVTWAAFEGGRAVGFVSLYHYTRMPDLTEGGGGWGYVAQLYVRPQARRRGHATALMADLTAEARARDLSRLVLHPSEEQRAFYASLGYRQAEELLLLPLG